MGEQLFPHPSSICSALEARLSIRRSVCIFATQRLKYKHYSSIGNNKQWQY